MRPFCLLLLLAVAACATSPEPYRNRYAHAAKGSFWQWKIEQWRNGLPPEAPAEGWNIPHRDADVARLRDNRTQATATWLGHATFLVQLGGANVLFDPIFSERASPVGFAGPKRIVPVPLAIEQLPRIDVVAISHNHYDHLDLASVRALARQPGGSPLFVVPAGLKAWFSRQGIDHVVERAWWESHQVAGLRFTLVPVQHWSKRTFWDTNESLWGGWVVEGAGLKLVHTGDLGYSRDVADVGARLGPFDLAMIPIGAYAPRWFMAPQHVDVAEALQVRRDLRATRALAMHWGTFEGLTDEPLDEPPRLLAALRTAAGLPAEAFDVMAIGETRTIAPATSTGGGRP